MNRFSVFQQHYKVFYYAFNAKMSLKLFKTRKNYKLFSEDYENIKKEIFYSQKKKRKDYRCFAG